MGKSEVSRLKGVYGGLDSLCVGKDERSDCRVDMSYDNKTRKNWKKYGRRLWDSIGIPNE